MNSLRWPERHSSSQSYLFNAFNMWREQAGKMPLPPVTLEKAGETVDQTALYEVRDPKERVLVKAWLAYSPSSEPEFALEATIRHITRTGTRRDVSQQSAETRLVGTSAAVVAIDTIKSLGALPKFGSLLRPGKHICDQLVAAGILQIEEQYVGGTHGPFHGVATLAVPHRHPTQLS